MYHVPRLVLMELRLRPRPRPRPRRLSSSVAPAHVGIVLMLGGQQHTRGSAQPPREPRQKADRAAKKQIGSFLGGVPSICPVCVFVLRDGRHGKETGGCVRSAVDVIGRCNGPCQCQCPPSWTGARESVPSHVRPCYCFISLFYLFSQSADARWWYLMVCTLPLSSWGLSVLPLARSDWLMLVELNFLLRI